MYLFIKNMRRGAGFSLIELITVVAIIAILATVALPILHNNKEERAAIIESLNVVGNIKTSIESDLNLSKDISQQSYNTPTGVSVSNGSTSGASININLSQTSQYFDNPNDIIKLDAIVNGSTIQWTCSHNINASTLTTGNVPPTCRDTFSN